MLYQPIDFRSFTRPVIFFANAVGDHVVSLPALRALSSIFDARVELICLPDSDFDFFSHIGFSATHSIIVPAACGETWLYQAQNISNLPFDHDGLASQISGCDLFISLSLWHSEDLHSLLNEVKPSLSIGFSKDYGCVLYNDSEHKHAFDQLFQAVHVLSPTTKIEPFAFPPMITSYDMHNANRILGKHLGMYRLLIVHTDTKRRKMWCAEKFLEVVDTFLGLKRYYIAVVVGLDHGLLLHNAIHRERILDASGLALGTTFAIIREGDLFLGIDSCMLHVADLFRIPGVGLFGPTDPEKWGFRFSEHVHVKGNDMKSIVMDEVLFQLLSLS